MSDPIGDRIKANYEKPARSELTHRMPVIMRIDGKCFSNYTRGCTKPFDLKLMDAMDQCAIALCKQIQGAQIAYDQSDEISILIHSYKKFDSDAWIGNQIQKMLSVAASIAAAEMTMQSINVFGDYKKAAFDARVFTIPPEEVCNCFLWRQQDWSRNSLQMLARSLYSSKELHGKKTDELHEMIFRKGQNWNNLDTHLKRGRCIVRNSYEVTVSPPVIVMGGMEDLLKNGPKLLTQTRSNWVVDNEIPVFSQTRGYINKHLAVEEE